GADTGGGLDRSTLDQLSSRHIAVQTLAFGSPRAPRDIELERVTLQPQAMEKSRVRALAQVLAYGFAGQNARLTVSDGRQLLAATTFQLDGDGDVATVPVMFNAGAAGPKTLTFALAPLPGEASARNNQRQRLLNVVSNPHRILYIEGEPRWEYKFIRRAESTDPQVQLVSMVRATENKIYRQGISDPSELADGFPSRPDDMFRYQGLIIGSVQAAYFTPAQQDLIEAFANRRGGGILFLGGEFALADGGWQDSPLAPLLPVTLPNHTGTFVRADLTTGVTAQAHALLTGAGARSAITRLLDDPDANTKKWASLPWLMDYQDAGTAKPAATVLANVRSPQGRVTPLLVTENYGRGRTAVLATSGTWRWQMNLPLGDPTFTLFWQQLLHWLVASTPGPVTVSTAHTMLYDQGQVTLQAAARDSNYNPDPGAQLQLSVLGPSGARSSATLRPSPGAPGEFTADYNASQPGAYIATVSDGGGHDATVAFERVDGAAEAFDAQAHPDFLARLAEETGGESWQPNQAAALAAAVPYASAGLSSRQNLPLWNLPAVFLLLGALALAEWLLRRKWGMV
ncbi:MAG: glutamine amidotransferase, partial [Terriglobales bacterium]